MARDLLGLASRSTPATSDELTFLKPKMRVVQAHNPFSAIPKCQSSLEAQRFFVIHPVTKLHMNGCKDVDGLYISHLV